MSPVSLSLPLATLSTWLTPPWLIGMGAVVGLLVLAVVYGLAHLVSRKAATFFNDSLREGFLTPVLILAAMLAVGAIAASPIVPVRDLWRSLLRLPTAGKLYVERTIPPNAKDVRVDLEIRPSELKTLQIKSDQDVMLTLVEFGLIKEEKIAEKPVIHGEELRWERAKAENNFFYGNESVLSVKNLSNQPARITFTGDIAEEFPEVAAVPQTAAALVGLVALFLVFKLLCPKITAIGLATTREVLVQPLFQVVMALGIFAIVVSVIIPYNTFGEDVKMLKLSDVTLIKVFAIIVAIWTASESISSELEGRTAMTVLSKPIGRRQFILGKFLGVVLPAALMFLFLGALLLVMVSYKVVYDAREVAQLEPTWQTCAQAMISTIPGLLLAFFETVMLAAVGVALSTRLPTLANLIVCSSVYVVGHLVPMLVMSRIGDTYGIIRFVGQLIAAVFPVLDHFDIEATVSTGNPVPLEYLAMAGGYCLLYCTVAMLLALVLFEDRDLA
jgi:ABC-type transport system involved in multi-copper enzyme maturation permease subunit